VKEDYCLKCVIRKLMAEEEKKKIEMLEALGSVGFVSYLMMISVTIDTIWCYFGSQK